LVRAGRICAKLSFHCAGFGPSKAAYRRRVEHRLDAAAHTARRFGRLGPDRIKHLHDQPGINRCDGQFSQNRVNVGCERVPPLLTVLGVPPAGFVAGDKFFRNFPKRAPLDCGKPLLLSLCDLGIERIDPVLSYVIRRTRGLRQSSKVRQHNIQHDIYGVQMLVGSSA
jgi:hypothetical protein